MSPRPNQCGPYCLYDEKAWKDTSSSGPLNDSAAVVEYLACLYLAGKLGDADMISDLTNDSQSRDVVIFGGKLDQDVRGVVDTESRFRNALSEQLAYWTRLGTEAQCTQNVRFAYSTPNVQPEDHGPDGVFVSLGVEPRVEVHSVKNSEGNPRGLIASGRFRTQGIPSRGKLLDDLRRQVSEGDGFIRLDIMLSNVSQTLGLTADQQARHALLVSCAFNAVVVADHRHASSGLFDGYQHVTGDPGRHIATYIGSVNWVTFAERVRISVKSMLQNAGGW